MALFADMSHQFNQAYFRALRAKAEREIKRRDAERLRRDVERLVDRRVQQKQGVPA